MADIGSTLRDTRIRNKIDISSVESATKIRAKYLRALENEEWNVLPGPTYVKSFLRTYAEYLGLDPHILIEDFSARYDEPEELEVPAFAREAPVRERVRRVGPPSRPTIAIVFAVGFIGLLLFLGLTGGNGSDNKKATQGAKSNAAQPAHKPAQHTTPTGGTQPGQPAVPPGQVAVQIVPTRQVWVCLINAKGRAKVNGVVLSGGDKQGPYRSKSFEITVGNGGGDFLINGKRRNVPETADPVGYEVTPDGVKSLPQAKQPTCQ